MPQTFTRLVGIHGPNTGSLTEDDYRWFDTIDPAFILVCQQEFGNISYLRQRYPNAILIGRMFNLNGLSTWDLPWKSPEAMYRYGQDCGNLMTTLVSPPDILQWCNEPGVDDPKNEWVFTEQGYKILGTAAEAWLNGYRSTRTKVLTATPPMSPGHKFEDDPLNEGWCGADIVRNTWQKFDVLLIHAYWTSDQDVEPPWGWMRWQPTKDKLGWGKLWAITECNGPRHLTRRAFDLLPHQDPSFLGVSWFIWKTDSPEFKPYEVVDDEPTKNLFAEYNHRQKEGPMPIPNNLQVTWDQVLPTLEAGKAISLHAYIVNKQTGAIVPIQGIGTAFVRVPVGPDGYPSLPWMDQVAMDVEDSKTDPDDVDGNLYFRFRVPDVPQLTEPVWTTVDVSYLVLDPKTFETQNLVATHPVQLVPAGQVPQTPEETRMLPPEYDAIWAYLGTVHDLAKQVPDPELMAMMISAQEYIKYLKGEREANFSPPQ